LSGLDLIGLKVDGAPLRKLQRMENWTEIGKWLMVVGGVVVVVLILAAMVWRLTHPLD